MSQLIKKLEETAAYMRNRFSQKPEIGIILGSGLGTLVEDIVEGVNIPYEDIPHFSSTTVIGHPGRVVVGKFAGKVVMTMQGRFHYYEGYSMQQVAYPVRLMGWMGIHTLLVTNASGGINSNFSPGDLMVIRDHINLMGDSPLRGPNENSLGPRFPDMTEAYPQFLRRLAYRAAVSAGVRLQEGIYAGIPGPSYETPAEINFLRTAGADAVGMSTVPEVIAANHQGIKVLGISCITNMAAGILQKKLVHEEVMEVAKQAQGKFRGLLRNILQEV